MDERGRWRRLRAALRQREHAVIVGYLAGLAALLAIAVLPALRNPLLVAVEKLEWRSEQAWEPRIARAEALLAAGDDARAAKLLRKLDRELPAPSVKYARDKQRERVLAGLAEAERRLGHKRAALAAARAAREFDPLNYANALHEAELAEALQEPAVAHEARQAVVALLPSHLPSVAVLVEGAAAGGDCAKAVDVFERYLDALEFGSVVARADGFEQAVRVPQDGRWHRVVWRGAFRQQPAIETDVEAATIEPLAWAPPLDVGREPAAGSAPAGTLVARVRLAKPVDPALRDTVRRCSANLLAWSRWAEIEARLPEPRS